MRLLSILARGASALPVDFAHGHPGGTGTPTPNRKRVVRSEHDQG
jgi:hypothetical protein